MSSSPVTPIRPNNPFETARLALTNKLLALPVPGKLSVFPTPSEFTAIIDHMREAAGLFDDWLAAIGHQVDDNASGPVDMSLFRSAFTDAIDGNAMWEVEKQAEMLIEEQIDMARSA